MNNGLHMQNYWLRLLSIAIFSFSTLLPSGSVVAKSKTKNPPIDISSVYKIELVVFADAYRDHEQSEVWTAPNELKYPDNLTFLISEQELANNENLVSSLQYKINKSLQQTNSIDNTTSGTDVSTAVTQESSTNENTTETALTAENESEHKVELIPPLLTAIKEQDSQLQSIANTLNRRSRYQLLFHSSWYQSLGEKRSAPSIPIRGGNQYGEQYQLEGSVIISRGRYLHITTDLWLIDWQIADNWHQQTPWYLRQKNPLNVPPFPKRPTSDDITLLQEQLNTLSKENEIEEEFELKGTTNSNKIISAQQSGYIPSQVFTLREYRRMKRNEVHYLDHPLFGAIVVISKYESELEDDQ